MLKIGVQSKGILDSELLDLETGFERIKKAGFDCIDLNLDVFLKNSELYQGEMNRFFEQSMEELRQYFTSYQEEPNNTAFPGPGCMPRTRYGCWEGRSRTGL